MTDVLAQTWLQSFGASCGAGSPIVACFPHAGGSASFYRGWAAPMAPTRLVAVKYPGRADRFTEPVPTCLMELGARAAEALTEILDGPLILFGHSMGALAAFEAARALERAGADLYHLFVSGSRAGPAAEPQTDAPEETDANVVEHLRAIGGLPESVLTDPDFLELVLPYVRSDGAMYRRYRMETAPPLACPITAIVGVADAHADRRPWPKLTCGGFRALTPPGGHFYLTDDPPLGLLSEVCEAVAAPPRVATAGRRR